MTDLGLGRRAGGRPITLLVAALLAGAVVAACGTSDDITSPDA